MRVLALALVLLSSTVGATAAAAPGTFFFIEGGVGLGLGEAFPEGSTGLATGLTLGAGGKPRGWPLRFYGVLNLDWAGLSADFQSPSERSTIERQTFGWSVGLRVIAPVVQRLRFVAETSFGALAVDGTASLGGGAEVVSVSDSSFLVHFVAGLQWRFNLWFSAGLKCDLQIPTGLRSFDPLAEAAGASSSDGGIANLGLGLTATLHL